MSARILAIVVLVVALLAPRQLHADDGSEAVARKVLIVLRALAYDRALATRAPGNELVVMVVNAPTADGRADRDRWLSGFVLLPNVKAQGRKVRATSVELDLKTLDATIARLKPALVIIGSGLTQHTRAITQVSRARKALTFSLSEADVRGGVALGLVATDHGDSILINVDGARSEGAKFSAGLLQLARLVDEDRP